MDEIEVIIRIPEEWIEQFKAFEHPSALQVCVLQGIVLPKGHGRLIDADELKKHKYHDNDRFENAVAVAQIDWADTIIEADREAEDD